MFFQTNLRRTPTVDGQNPAPPEKSGNPDSLVNTNKQWFPLVAKSCRISSIYSMTKTTRICEARSGGTWLASRDSQGITPALTAVMSGRPCRTCARPRWGMGGSPSCQLFFRTRHMAIGQKLVISVNIQIPTKITPKMGGAPTPKWYHWF